MNTIENITLSKDLIDAVYRQIPETCSAECAPWIIDDVIRQIWERNQTFVFCVILFYGYLILDSLNKRFNWFILAPKWEWVVWIIITFLEAYMLVWAIVILQRVT